MAVPTFSSVTPTTGPAGGRNVLEITGTNFRVSPTNGLTVAVTVDGITALAEARSATLLHVVAPAFERPNSAALVDPLPTVDIVITNLDDDGDPIVGETVTAAAAYTYERFPLRPPASSLEGEVYHRIIRKVLETFGSQLHPNIAIGTNVDYGDTGALVIKAAQVPQIILTGPRIEEDFENRHHWADFFEINEGGGPPERIVSRWPGFVATLGFEAILATNNQRELWVMMQGLAAMFMRTPYLYVPANPAFPNLDRKRFPFVLTEPPRADIQEGESNLFVAIATFEVRWVPFRLDDNVRVEAEVTEPSLSLAGVLTLGGASLTLDDETVTLEFESVPL